MDRMIVAFAGQEARRRMLHLLRRCGYDPACCRASGAEAIRAASQLGNAAVICGFRLPDMTADELAENLSGIAPVLAVSSAANLALCRGRNLRKLSVPASLDEFRAALESLRGPSLRKPAVRSEEERRLIQQAKALLMEQDHLSEEEAHRLLQKRSMDAGQRLAEMACSFLREKSRQTELTGGGSRTAAALAGPGESGEAPPGAE